MKSDRMVIPADVQRAIAHEAGHIFIALKQGIRIHEMAVELHPRGGGFDVGDMMTVADDPTDEQIKELSQGDREAFALFCAGGAAGNKFDGVREIAPSASSDRENLKRFTDKSLETVSDQALSIIRGDKRMFRRIKSMGQQRFRDLFRTAGLQHGRHILMSGADFEAIYTKK